MKTLDEIFLSKLNKFDDIIISFPDLSPLLKDEGLRIKAIETILYNCTMEEIDPPLMRFLKKEISTIGINKFRTDRPFLIAPREYFNLKDFKQINKLAMALNATKNAKLKAKLIAFAKEKNVDIFDGDLDFFKLADFKKIISGRKLTDKQKLKALAYDTGAIPFEEKILEIDLRRNALNINIVNYMNELSDKWKEKLLTSVLIKLALDNFGEPGYFKFANGPGKNPSLKNFSKLKLSDQIKLTAIKQCNFKTDALCELKSSRYFDLMGKPAQEYISKLIEMQKVLDK